MAVQPTKPGRGIDGHSLLQKQQMFARYLGQILAFIHAHQDWAVTLSEGYVGDTDAADADWDGPHMRSGCHYLKLAQDLNLFVSGVFVRGAHPAWDEIGATWLALNPLCRWGGTFASRDWNHLSITHEGRQ